MEIEMKYSLPDKQTAEALWEDEELKELTDRSTAESLIMKAVYFDTEDRVLSGNDVAFRVRTEGDLSFATIKYGGRVENGLHERGEVNIPVSSGSYFIQPDLEILRACEEGRMLCSLTEGKPLLNLLEMHFLRKRCRLSYGGSLIELSVDTGSIITDNGDIPILELELELYAGTVEDIKAMGAKLAEKYCLVPQDKSKLARGLELINS